MRSSRPGSHLVRSIRQSQPFASRTHPHTHLREFPHVHFGRCIFHTTPCHQKPPKRKHQNVKHDELERISTQRASAYKAYTEAEKADLAKRYTPEQLAAIEAGEAAIPISDLETQAKFRRDPLRFQYLDDFSRIEPVIDKKVERLRADPNAWEEIEGANSMPFDGEFFGKTAQIFEDAQTLGKWIEVEDDISNASPFRKMEFRRTQKQIYEAAREEVMKDPKTLEKIRRFNERTPTAEELRSHAERGGELETDWGRLHRYVDRAEGTAYFVDVDDSVSLDASYFTSTEEFKQLCERIASEDPPPNKRFGTSPTQEKVNAIYQDGPNPEVAPTIPKINDPTVQWNAGAGDTESDVEGLDESEKAAFKRLSKQLGLDVAQLRRFRLKRLVSKRVSNQTPMGKIPSMYALYVAGNEDGIVGLGEGKAKTAKAAQEMARMNAIRNMAPILRYENRTIFGEVAAKVGAAEVTLSAGSPGFGLRVSHHVFEIARCAGLTDLSARVGGSRNPMNASKAIWEALRSQRNPEDVARGRGKKFVDVRKVYNSGLV